MKYLFNLPEVLAPFEVVNDDDLQMFLRENFVVKTRTSLCVTTERKTRIMSNTQGHDNERVDEDIANVLESDNLKGVGVDNIHEREFSPNEFENADFLEIRYANLVLLRYRNLLLHLARFVTEMENMNFEDFLIKPRNFWLNKSTTNLYSSLNGLPEIVMVLKQVKQLGELRKTCFGHLLAIPKEVTCSAGVMHNFMLRQICIPGVTREDEFHFLIFQGDENLQLKHVWEKFMGGQFEQPNDGLKMALVLIANNVLFGQDLRRKVSLWLFALVEDLKSFDSFPWGSYVYMMTIHYLSQGFRSANASRKVVAYYNLYGFPWALLPSRLKNWRIFKRPHNFFAKFAKYEQEVNEGKFVPLNYDDGEQRPNDDGNDDDVDVDVADDDDANDGGDYKSDVEVLCSDFFAKLSEERKKFQPSEDAPLSCEFDALKYKCLTDWILYAAGDKPWWGTAWSTVKRLLVPCDVGDPAGHWILCDVDLEKRSVCIYDPLYKTTNIQKRVKQITPLLRLIPAILQASGYFDKRGIAPDGMMFVVEQSIPKKLPAQLDSDSCGVFTCRYADMLMRRKCFWGWGTKNIPSFREEMALEIYANSVPTDS
ncbi:hypothetical protein Ddye_028418 [Dipteronia dyeriana]|uniref:Ubiquitin-like protease family profile domain-containing protein n=1 Tax=Dipteronia dyeriana TaxID=168575 RepID=A0AAD9WSA9_9ROSI|nr:hypothetical protein Ddye_028418 [Dipteronia dyeriana]